MTLKIQSLKLPRKQYQCLKSKEPQKWIGRLWHSDKGARNKNVLTLFKHLLKYGKHGSEVQTREITKSTYEHIQCHEKDLKRSEKSLFKKLERKYIKLLPLTVQNVAKEKLICPITLDEIEHPVKTPCNHIFERAALQEWLLNHWECPMDRRPLFAYQVKDL